MEHCEMDYYLPLEVYKQIAKDYKSPEEGGESHSQVLHALSRNLGFKNWQELRSNGVFKPLKANGRYDWELLIEEEFDALEHSNIEIPYDKKTMEEIYGDLDERIPDKAGPEDYHGPYSVLGGIFKKDNGEVGATIDIDSIDSFMMMDIGNDISSSAEIMALYGEKNEFITIPSPVEEFMQPLMKELEAKYGCMVLAVFVAEMEGVEAAIVYNTDYKNITPLDANEACASILMRLHDTSNPFEELYDMAASLNMEN